MACAAAECVRAQSGVCEGGPYLWVAWSTPSPQRQYKGLRQSSDRPGTHRGLPPALLLAPCQAAGLRQTATFVLQRLCPARKVCSAFAPWCLVVDPWGPSSPPTQNPTGPSPTPVGKMRAQTWGLWRLLSIPAQWRAYWSGPPRVRRNRSQSHRRLPWQKWQFPSPTGCPVIRSRWARGTDAG